MPRTNPENMHIYKFRKEKRYLVEKNKMTKEVAEEIGLCPTYLCTILDCKNLVKRKIVAYAITKYADPEAEIEDYFEEIK